MTGAETFARAIEDLERRVREIPDGEWHSPSPCTGWDVRDVLNHVVAELLWMPPLLAGSTIEEVGDRFSGDVLGADPVGALERAGRDALAASRSPGVGDRSVHLSFGDIPAAEYVTQVTCDVVVHTWDVARGAGLDDTLDPSLVEVTDEYLAPRAAAWQASGVFAPPVEVAPDAPPQERLLARTGRRARPGG